jgi:hypothetical protein
VIFSGIAGIVRKLMEDGQSATLPQSTWEDKGRVARDPDRNAD